MKNEFISGLELSRRYYHEMVKPILDENFLNINYSAGLLGWGSEVLGFDTHISQDHHFGPRFFIFLNEDDEDTYAEKIKDTLSKKLPHTFLGFSTNFGEAQSNGVRLPVKTNSGPVNHMIDIYTIRSFFKMRLKFDPYKDISFKDWLMFPQQILLEMVSGEVFYDGLNELNMVREKFNFYPDDVWLYMLASQWSRIATEEEYVGRCGDAGDELGSKIVATKIVKGLMDLCFLIEKKYHPYTKWFGSAFAKLQSARVLSPIFQKVFASGSWTEREQNLSLAYEYIATLHNLLGITKPMTTKVSSYHGRPYLTIHADEFANEIIKSLKFIKVDKNFGGVDQFIDRMDLLSSPKILREIDIWK